MHMTRRKEKIIYFCGFDSNRPYVPSPNGSNGVEEEEEDEGKEEEEEEEGREKNYLDVEDKIKG